MVRNSVQRYMAGLRPGQRGSSVEEDSREPWAEAESRWWSEEQSVRRSGQSKDSGPGQSCSGDRAERLAGQVQTEMDAPRDRGWSWSVGSVLRRSWSVQDMHVCVHVWHRGI